MRYRPTSESSQDDLRRLHEELAAVAGNQNLQIDLMAAHQAYGPGYPKPLPWYVRLWRRILGVV